MNKSPARSPFDQVFIDQPKALMLVESRLSIILKHEPIQIEILKEAYFEIERRTKNVVSEVFTEFGITAAKEKYIEIQS